MQCADIDRLVDQLAPDKLASDPGAAHHMRGCKRCRVLYGDWSAFLGPGEPSSSLKESIARTILADLKPVRPQPPAYQTAAAVLFVVSALAFGLATFAGTAGLQRMSGVQVYAFAGVGVLAAILLAFGLANLMHPVRQRPALAAAGVGVLASGFAGVALLLFSSAEPSSGTGVACFTKGLLLSVPGALLVGLLVRRGYVLRTALAGAVVGALAVLSAATVLQVSCPDQNATHHVTSHGGAILVAIIAGFLIGWRLGR
ncbi:MAG: NrsF family protein [Bryobacteraceae bacterium]